MKIFVTGATGFIGRHIVRLLSQKGYNLMLLVRRHSQNLSIAEIDDRKAHIVYGNLSDMDNWRKDFIDFGPDALIHAAWEGLPDYGIEMCRRNFDYGLNLFIMAAETGCKTIMSIGSCWEYKEKKGSLNENSIIDSTKVFPAFKNALKIAGEAIAREYNIRFYWPRLFFIYGPGQRKTSLIPSIIKAVSAGEMPDIKNPANRNDFVYVEDAADALVKIIQKKPDGIIYNIGSGHSTSVLDILSSVYKMMGCPDDGFPKNKEANNNIIDDFWADIESIRKDVGWHPNFTLDEGIKNTIHHFSKLGETGVIK